MLPKAILLDLDDTIISYNGAADAAWQISCSNFVSALKPSFDEAALLDSVYKARNWYWGDPERHRTGRMDLQQARRDVVRIALEDLNYFHAESTLQMADGYSRLQEELIRMFPQSEETLEKLKSMGIKMVLVTNGTTEKQRGKIERFNLSRFFEFCLVEGEVGFGKPDTRVFQLALERLDLSPGQVWMVGDNLVWDVEAPQKLGIHSIWNDYRKEGLPAGTGVKPDRIIHSIAELLE